MVKTTTKIILMSLLSAPLFAQNVGIGTNTPIGKTHVVQTAATDVILVDHSGTAGNSIEINQTDANNANSAVFIKNSGTQQAILSQVLNTASTASVIQGQNIGLGNVFTAQNLNTGASGAGLFIEQNGSGAFSRGVDINMDAGNSAIGTSIFHTGTGRGIYMDLSNNANASTGLALYHDG